MKLQAAESEMFQLVKWDWTSRRLAVSGSAGSCAGRWCCVWLITQLRVSLRSRRTLRSFLPHRRSNCDVDPPGKTSTGLRFKRAALSKGRPIKTSAREPDMSVVAFDKHYFSLQIESEKGKQTLTAGAEEADVF